MVSLAMRLSEISLLATMALAIGGLVWCSGSRHGAARRGTWPLAVPVILVLVLHLSLEGARWAMMPGYLMAAATISVCVLPIVAVTRVRRLVAATGFCLLGLASGLAAALPLLKPPPATGPSPVANVTLTLREHVEDSQQTSDDLASRALSIEVWYPADWSASAIPGATLRQARSRYPVILYFHGWGGHADDNSVLTKDLASHGFLVAAIEYPFGLGQVRNAASASAHLDLDGPLDFSTEQAAGQTELVADRKVRLQAQDAVFVLDQLAAMNAGSPPGPFAHRLDLNRVGLVGYSIGGAVAAEASRNDPRFKAV